MPDAKLKCSNCGAEVTNLTIGWRRREMLWSVLFFVAMILAIIVIPKWMFRTNRAFVQEIVPTIVEKKVTDDQMVILGRLKNEGTHTWGSVTVEAEVYDKDGTFLDEQSDYLSVMLTPGSEENFRVTFENAEEKVLDPSAKVTLKVTDAEEDRF